jgi:hypothetical protein
MKDLDAIDGVFVSFPVLRRELQTRLFVGVFEMVIVGRKVSGIVTVFATY